jgi:hypothetical protein
MTPNFANLADTTYWRLGAMVHYPEAQQPSLHPAGFSEFKPDAFSSLNHNSYETSVQYLQLYTM